MASELTPTSHSSARARLFCSHASSRGATFHLCPQEPSSCRGRASSSLFLLKSCLLRVCRSPTSSAITLTQVPGTPSASQRSSSSSVAIPREHVSQGARPALATPGWEQAGRQSRTCRNKVSPSSRWEEVKRCVAPAGGGSIHASRFMGPA